MNPRNATTALSAKAPKQLVDSLRTLATKQDRSVSAELRLAVAAWLRQHSPEPPIDNTANHNATP